MTAAAWSTAELEWPAARYVPASEGAWTESAWAGFEERSLGLGDVSGGILDACHLRRGRGAVAGGTSGDLDLHLLYVLEGTITVADGDGEPRTLGKGAAAYHPGGTGFRVLDASGGFEAVQLSGTGPADGEAAPDASPVYALDAPGAHVLGDGPRPNVRYRHLRVAEHSGGRYRAWVNSAEAPVRDMDIWHFHDMAQFFVVLDGWALVEVRGAEYEVRPGDALAIGAGRANQHNVRHIGAGFQILELCVPAEYGTWPGEAPTSA